MVVLKTENSRTREPRHLGRDSVVGVRARERSEMSGPEVLAEPGMGVLPGVLKYTGNFLDFTVPSQTCVPPRD